MPGLRTNLTSLGQLCNDGLHVVLTKADLRAYPAGAISTNGIAPVVRGERNASTSMWDIPLGSSTLPPPTTPAGTAFSATVTDPTATTHNIVAAKNLEQLANWYHRALFSPRPSTLLKAIAKGHFRSWPGLTQQLINKHLQPSINTALGHMKLVRQGQRSTKKAPFAAWTLSLADEEEDMFQPVFTEEMEAGAMYTKIVGSHDITDKMYADTAGPFPITSAKGNRYFRITYVVDANAILVVPMKDRQRPKT
mmetsp:Transcript_21094/g.60490  ORF Transcript_21094/g.60490 Transcript_21094/m.60490 type:complete len:251 (-) Transcript_21094:511-1263(-)